MSGAMPLWLYLLRPVVSCSPDVMGGTAVFYGTRVPVQTLLDYLEAGETIDDFLEGFPSVTREQVIAFLERGSAQPPSSLGMKKISQPSRIGW